MPFRGVLADANCSGTLLRLQLALERLDVKFVFDTIKLHFATFQQLGIDQAIDDRTLWHYCQDEGWILLTDNRNHDDADSLQATLNDSWLAGQLPVITIGNKDRFGHDWPYTLRVSNEIAGYLMDAIDGNLRDRPRIFVPERDISN